MTRKGFTETELILKQFSKALWATQDTNVKRSFSLTDFLTKPSLVWQYIFFKKRKTICFRKCQRKASHMGDIQTSVSCKPKGADLVLNQYMRLVTDGMRTNELELNPRKRGGGWSKSVNVRSENIDLVFGGSLLEI